MGKLWVLDTETKGTGAQMVPLDSVLNQSAPKRPSIVRPKADPKPPAAPQAKPAREFKVVDVVSRRVLAEGADARTTVELLGGVRSVVDVSMHVWQPQAKQWRLLSPREKRVLWDAAHPPAGEPSSR